MAAEMAARCYLCEKNQPEDNSPICKSCELEYPFCYSCGENERNFPFKLCLKCYRESHGPLRRPVPSTQDKKPVLERLDSKKAEYKRAYDLFKETWVKNPPPPEPEAIYAICNKKLCESFREHVESLRAKDSDATTSYNFHGTKIRCNLLETDIACSNKLCGVCGISQRGFDKDLIGTNIPKFKRYGHGLYLAPNSSKCHDYTQGTEEVGLRAQLLCLVASGTKFKTKRNHTQLSNPPQNCDSVFGVAGPGGVLNYEETVVYESCAISPEFVIVYRRDSVQKIAQ